MLELLGRRGEVTLLVWDPVDFVAIDRYYGTRLSEKKIHVVLVSSLARRILQYLKLPHYLVKLFSLEGKAKSMRGEYDFCYSAFNDLDLGPPAVQYIHHPNRMHDIPSPQARSWAVVWPLYLWTLRRISGHRLAGVQSNYTIVNSRWTGRNYQDQLGGPVHAVIYPPPLGRCLAGQGTREFGFIAVGRVDRVKNWLRIIEIMIRLRERGHNLKLTLAGGSDDEKLLAELRVYERLHFEWLTLAIDLPRPELDQLITRHRFAIHAMVDEHYGMAVAELVLAGCLTFVHDSGGQVEIVSQPEARFSDVADGVEKIERVLTNPTLANNLLEAQAGQQDRLGRARFVRDMENFMDRLEAGDAFPPLDCSDIKVHPSWRSCGGFR